MRTIGTAAQQHDRGSVSPSDNPSPTNGIHFTTLEDGGISIVVASSRRSMRAERKGAAEKVVSC